MLGYTWVFIAIVIAFLYTLSWFIQLLGGSLHAVIVGAASVSVVPLFWSLFVYDHVPLMWRPSLEAYTWIAMVGCIMMLPPIAVFGYYRQVDDRFLPRN